MDHHTIMNWDFLIQNKESLLVSTDTRNLPAGCVFFALHGEHFDGNKFALQALEQGASLVVIDDPEVFSTLNSQLSYTSSASDRSSKGEIRTAIDCWENEPDLNQELLKKVDLASFHIAGYSIQGKMNASEMCLRAFCEFFSLPILSINKKAVPLQGDSEKGWLLRITEQLKATPEHFEQLRKQYRLR
mgnify:CR=1 FL=1